MTSTYAGELGCHDGNEIMVQGATEPLKAEGHDLTAGEAADLGPLPRAVSSALRDVAGCRKTYVALFAEADGFQHIHFHIMPRQPGLEADLRGPRVFGLLGGDPASYVPEEVMDEIADRLSQALHREL